MNLTIKQLKQYDLIFVPQTTAEAVLVNEKLTDGTLKVITLDTLLKKKVENIITPAGSGLQAVKLNENIYLTHSNSITANESPSSVKVQYDNRGHIVDIAPTSNINVIVDLKGYFLYNGSEERNMMLGNDFEIDDNNKIILKWNHL